MLNNNNSQFFSEKKLTILFLLIIAQAYAQWQPEMRLTTSSEDSKLTYSERCIEANGQIVHVVYYDYRDFNWEIYYKRSSDNGISWATGLRLTNNTAMSVLPSITVSGSVLHVVWSDDRDGNPEIYYKRSPDGGISWGADTRLTNAIGESRYPSVSVSGQVVHLLWQDSRNGNSEIYYKRSTDGGTSWGADTRLTNNSPASVAPSIAVSGSLVHIVWQEYRDGNDEIYYKRSTDGGTSWGADTRLTNNSDGSVVPSITVSGSVLHVVWQEYRDGNPEIYYKRSPDGGISWGADARLTNAIGESRYPSVSVSGQVVHLVWQDSRDGNYEIYYKRSTDGGVNWESDLRLTNNNFISSNPSVTISGTIVHVVWDDNRNGNYSIYYRQNPTGNPIGIKYINSDLPKEFSLGQNYPNPFNPTTNIQFAIPKTSIVNLVVYDVLGKEIAVLVNEELKAGLYNYDWDASYHSSGVYYYRLEAGDFIEMKKMVLLK